LKSRFRVLAVGAATVLAASVSAVPLSPASAATGYAYFGATGGTQIQAVGTTISSSMTAMSQVAGVSNPASTSNQLATVKAAPLANIGAVKTSETATRAGDGWKLEGTARTAGVNLLNGLVKVDAVETATSAQLNSTEPAAGTGSTRFVNLTIAGKSYPVDLPRNTTVTVPGIATVVLNYQNIGTAGGALVTQGAGMVVTLLKAQGTAAIGSTIVLNPSFGLVQQASAPGGASLGGVAYGAFVLAHAGDNVEAKTTRAAYEVMPMMGTNSLVLENHTARASLSGVLNATTIASTAEGLSSPALNYAKLATRTARVNVFPSLLGSLIHADALGSDASVSKENGVTTMTGHSQFVNLVVAGQKIAADVGPNTTIHVDNLGYVTLNEQKQWAIDGFAHVEQVIALHIVLDTARAGLPVGAEIQLGVSQAIVWN
jgi:hypothetical protein